MNEHMTDEQLVLKYYAELEAAAATDQHLAECRECRTRLEELAAALELAASAPVPERDPYYGSRVWHNIKDRMEPHRKPASVFPKWILSGALAAALVGAFYFGRWTTAPAPRPEVARSDAGRARLLNAALVEHLDRSQRVLVEMANSDGAPDADWIEDIIAANRLYRQAALRAGQARVAAVMDDVERLLLEAKHASPGEAQYLKRRLGDQELLFKVRVTRDSMKTSLPSGSF
jgi:hypothetical protein